MATRTRPRRAAARAAVGPRQHPCPCGGTFTTGWTAHKRTCRPWHEQIARELRMSVARYEAGDSKLPPHLAASIERQERARLADIEALLGVWPLNGPRPIELVYE